jgi:uncharacterized protein with ParB-like and HNH nuclease domain
LLRSILNPKSTVNIDNSIDSLPHSQFRISNVNNSLLSQCIEEDCDVDGASKDDETSQAQRCENLNPPKESTKRNSFTHSLPRLSFFEGGSSKKNFKEPQICEVTLLVTDEGAGV